MFIHVIVGLRRPELKLKDDMAKEEIRKLIGYLTKNRGRVNYKSDRKGGYPIGGVALNQRRHISVIFRFL